MDRNRRPRRPTIEALERRELLSGSHDGRIIATNGKPINDQDLARAQVQKANGVALANRRIEYTTPEGSHVIVTLYGFGTLKGTAVDANGVLNLVYDNTTLTTRIIGKVSGGTGRAPMATLRDADTTRGNPSAVGVNPINVVNLRQFDLVDNGFVNLEGGVVTFFLGSAGANTELDIRDGATLLANTPNATAATADVELQTAVATATTANSFNTGTSATAIGVGGAPVVGGNTGGAVTLGTAANATPTFVGTQIYIDSIHAAPLGTPPLGDAQVFSVDAAAGTLLRFDAVNGNLLQTIPLPAGLANPRVGLGRVAGHDVALVGSGSTIFVFDGATGAPVGQFSTANVGIGAIDGIGSTETQTVINAAGTGPAVIIDVTASLASGQAVEIGQPFTPSREFFFTGGGTGVAGSGTIYLGGAAHFDTFQPNNVQFGIMAVSTAGGRLTEVSRTELPGNIDAGVPPDLKPSPFSGLGSVDSDLAAILGVSAGKNLVRLMNPRTLATDGSLSLNYPTALSGLSESFHPELAGAAIVNVLGNLKTYGSATTQGLILNVDGEANFVAIGDAKDTAIVGRPLDHVAIKNRNNVQLISNARGPKGVGTRGGVTVLKKLRVLGPLSPP